MIAARDLKYTACVRKDAFLDVFDPGPVHAHRHLILSFARHSAGVTTDALAVIDYEAVFHPREVSTRNSTSYVGWLERGVTLLRLVTSPANLSS
jgi:hypothetical protein